MAFYGWLQLFLFVVILFACTKPLGVYLTDVLNADGKTVIDPLVKPLEQLLYRFLRIDSKQEQTWKRYAVSLAALSMISLLCTYAILRLQQLLPLNPQGFGPLSPHLAFNTAVSFTTNTNWQSYGGESTMSYFSQMAGLTFHNFISAAAGIAVAAALVRGIARHSVKTIGSFWVDIIRVTLYLLLPLCLVYALFLVSQGMIQNFQPYIQATLIDTSVHDQGAGIQTIAQGPMASQVAIKLLGTNGGGFMNANAAHPYENPTPLSNVVQMLSILLIPSGLTYYLGRLVRKQRHGWIVWGSMLLLFLTAFTVCWWAEAAGNPRLHGLGVGPLTGNMEGKEVRFGIFNSALFATVTTTASCGAVNAMHDSFTPLGGLVPLFNIQLGEIVFGGVGAGLYGMLVFVVLAVFLCGLMVGRTPEYVGKKIEAYDVKMAVLSILVFIITILGFTAWAATSSWGLAGLANSGPHGLSELLYAYSSGTGNNGSAFAGLNTNTAWFNTTMGIAMLLGRFFMIIPILALAGNLARKKIIPASEGSLPVSGVTFMVMLIGTVLIVGALTFFPILSLGPIVEHFLMTGSNMLY